MSRRTTRPAIGAAILAPALLVPSVLAPAAGAAEPTGRAGTLAFLVAHQQADGGFDVGGFPGFETPDAVMAIAADHMVGGVWSTSAAGAAVAGISKDGKDAFDSLDALVDGVGDASSDAAGAQAAKIIALAVVPTGQSATDFDPADNSASPVDLVARMNLHRQADGSYDFGAQFNGALFAALALEALGESIPAGLVTQIREAQRSDGSWNYAGDQAEDSPGETDTTAMAVLALSAAGLDTNDATVKKAVSFLAAGQQASGAWQAFGADDPNSTAMASIALSAVKIDLTSAQWRSAFGGTVPANYTNPYAWLVAQQASDGRIASPNDSYGVTTFATSQAMQALAAQWHLRDEQTSLVGSLAARLAADAPTAVSLGYSAIGPNVSIGVARERAAHAIAMSQPGREVAAEALFQRAFQRGLDNAGRVYWSGELVRDSRSRVLVRLTGSPEFYERSGSNTAGFVENAYRAVLDRAPDTAGKAYWSQRLDAGEPVSVIAADLVASREYRQNEVDIAYQQMLGRAADAGGREFWTDRLATTRVEAILGGIGGSAEFYRRHA